MARTFNGTSAYISAPSAVGSLGNNTRTFSAWIRSTSIATRQAIYYEGIANLSQILLWEIESSNLFFNCGSGGALTGTATLLSNTWYHVAARYAGGSTTMFINGVQDSFGGGFNLATTADECSIGRYFQTPTSYFLFTGQIAEFAKHDIYLTDGEIAALANGASPLLVRPQELSLYAPLVRDVIDVNGAVLTDNGPTTVSEHIRIIR
jgi:hypothetical protein